MINIIDYIRNAFLGKKQTEDTDEVLRCPKCKGDQWLDGPGGGSFGNIKCVKCETKYNNMGPFGLKEIKY